MTILEEARDSLIVIEHDPLIYEDAGETTEYVAQALKQASSEAMILLHAGIILQALLLQGRNCTSGKVKFLKESLCPSLSQR